MANNCKNVAVLYLTCILVFVVAFQLCKADSDLQEGDVYKQCLKECDDKCKAEGYGEVFCHAKCSKPCEYQQKNENEKMKYAAIKDTATYLRRSISKATTNRMQSTDAGLVAWFGILMLALYN